MQMNDSDQTTKSKTAWSLPGQILGMLFLAVTFLTLIGLTRPFWFQLLLSACLAAITLRVIRFTQRQFNFSSRAATAVGILFLLLLVLLSIPVAAFITTSIDHLAASIAEFVITLAEDLINFLKESTSIILGVEATERTLIVGPLIEYLQNITGGASAVKNLVDSVFLFRNAVEGIINLISLGWTLIITMMFTLYMVTDPSWAHRGLERLIPTHHLEEIRTLVDHIILTWRTYVSGQLRVMFLVGLMVTFTTFLLGLPSSLALGIIAGILEAIPTYGPILAAIPALIVALIEGSRWFDINHLLLAVIVVLAYLVIQQIEEFLITPRIHSRGSKFSPVIIMLSVMVGAHEFGILGAILAIPVVASLREIVNYVLAKVSREEPFQELLREEM
jgi:predicted PurR-regulated permease PerM